MNLAEAYAALASGRYAFVDLGSGTGGSLEHCAKRFARGSGIGFELDSEEAAEANRAGHAVVRADVRDVAPPAGSVAFVSSMDFLEHLPSEADAAAALERIAPAAREFLFIRHPSFEDDEYLASLGLKVCWSDWTEHPNMMRVADLVAIFERLGWRDYAVFPRGLMADATDDQIVPLSAPRDTQIYDAAAHGPKPVVRFDRPVFAQYDIFVRFAGISDDEWARVLAAGLKEDEPVWPAWTSAPWTGRVRGDLGFYDAATSRWTVRYEDGREASLKYGAEGRGWRPFAGDFDGDARDGLGAYDPATGTFFMRNTVAEGDADVMMGFGAPGGIPVAGDWTGAGVDTVGVYQPETGQWFLRYENTSGPADESFSFGPPAAGWLPVVGDWTGEGRDSVGLYEPSTGSWHLRNGGDAFVFGPVGGLPVAGDWDGDGRDSIGIYKPEWGMWILRNTNANGPADRTFVYKGDGTPFAARF
jgi:hypothetical protein